MGDVLLLACLLCAGGCAAHLQLRVPPPTAPLAARVQTYQALRPKDYGTGGVVGAGCLLPNLSYLALGDGRYVYHPEDVLAVVPPGSACAHGIHDYLTGLRIRDIFDGVAVAGTVGGAATLSVGLLYAFAGSTKGLDLLGDGLLILLGSAITGLVGWVFGISANGALSRAYDRYGYALRAKLHLPLRQEIKNISAPRAAKRP